MHPSYAQFISPPFPATTLISRSRFPHADQTNRVDVIAVRLCAMCRHDDAKAPDRQYISGDKCQSRVQTNVSSCFTVRLPWYVLLSSYEIVRNSLEIWMDGWITI